MITRGIPTNELGGDKSKFYVRTYLCSVKMEVHKRVVPSVFTGTKHSFNSHNVSVPEDLLQVYSLLTKTEKYDNDRMATEC